MLRGGAGTQVTVTYLGRRPREYVTPSRIAFLGVSPTEVSAVEMYSSPLILP